MGDWGKIDFKGKTSGQVKVKCPSCINERSNKSDTSLSVNLDLGVGLCHYCQDTFFQEGSEKKSDEQKVTHFEIPEQTWQNYTNLSDKLVKWWRDVRGISQLTLEEFQIGEKENIPFGDKKMNAIVFNYFQDGVLVHEHYRSGDKRFSQLKDGKKVPYNIDSMKGQDYVIITEGQIDCMSISEAGYSSTISVPSGANSYGVIEQYQRSFDNKRIYLGTDKDYVGVDLEEKLIDLFGASRCFRIEYPLGCKDPNDVLVNHGKETLKECIETATCVALDGDVLASPEDMTDFVYKYYRGEIKGGLTLGLGTIFDNDVTFRENAYHIIIAKTNIGKSVIGYWACLRLAMLHGCKIVMLSMENSNSLIRHTLIDYYLNDNAKYVALNNADKWNEAAKFVDDHFYFLNNTAGWGLLESLEKAKAVKDAYGAQFLFLDPINSVPVVYPVQGMTEYSYHKWAAGYMMTYSKRDLAIIMTAHTVTEKGRNGMAPTMYDIEMGGTYINKADLVMVFDRPVDAEDNEDANTTRVWQTKARDRQIYGGDITKKDNPLMLRYTHHGFKFMIKNSMGFQDGQDAHYNNKHKNK